MNREQRRAARRRHPSAFVVVADCDGGEVELRMDPEQEAFFDWMRDQCPICAAGDEH